MIFNLLCGGIEKKQRIWRTCADVCKNLPFVWIVWEKIKQVLASHPSPIEDNIKRGENKGGSPTKIIIYTKVGFVSCVFAFAWCNRIQYVFCCFCQFCPSSESTRDEVDPPMKIQSDITLAGITKEQQSISLLPQPWLKVWQISFSFSKPKCKKKQKQLETNRPILTDPYFESSTLYLSSRYKSETKGTFVVL